MRPYDPNLPSNLLISVSSEMEFPVARLHEHQGKSLLSQGGIKTPRGHVITSPQEAQEAYEQLNTMTGKGVILKAQAWITGRKAKGGILFAQSGEEAKDAAEKLLSLSFGNFPVQEVLIEELIDIDQELFVSLTIDDSTRAPVLLVDLHGGSGIEERADQVARLAIDVETGVDRPELEQLLKGSAIPSETHAKIADAIVNAVKMAQKIEARSLEINPLVTTKDGNVVAADCRVTVDDYAVFRHDELGIEIARELDHPATELERIAYRIEQEDHRGTFYFAQLPTDGHEATLGLIGFHGAGGGGSMMSMDAVSSLGFTLANFTDTSGNPSAAKVYRAARVILSQPGLIGYFGSGSGVASQEQFHSAYGLAKAFKEMNVSMPVVIRLGGNAEDRAVKILESACDSLPGTIEGYRKDDTPAFCAQRFATLVESRNPNARSDKLKRSVPDFVGTNNATQFSINGGCIWIDQNAMNEKAKQVIAEFGEGLLNLDSEGITLAISEEEAAGKDSEFIGLEIELQRAGCPILFVDLAIEGIDTEAKRS